MTLTLDLPQEVMDRLAERAKAKGLDVTTLAEQAVWRESVFQRFAPPPSPADPEAEAWDMPYTREEAAARAANARAVFAEWAKEDEEADPEEELREWEEFKRNMNESRRLEGRPPAYPEDSY